MMERRCATVIDLFAGAGGFSLGFRAAGARLLAAVDVSETAGETYQRNFRVLQPRRPPRVFCGDEGNLEDLDLERVAAADTKLDILIGGPPCQGFSRIGRAKLASLAEEPTDEDPRNELYRRFMSAVRFWRPRAVVMENVPGMLSLRGTNIADMAAAELAACGYRVGYALLNAVWYGVPQFRERLFFIGIREDLGIEPSVPVPSHRADLPSGYRRPPEAVTIPFSFIPHYELAVPVERGRLPAVTLREAIGDLPAIHEHLLGESGRRPANFRVARTYEGPPRSLFARLMREWPGFKPPAVIQDHVVRWTPRDYETFRRMRPDDRYPDALRIAEARFLERLTDLARSGDQPPPGSPRYEELRRSFIPPYPVEKFVDKWRKLSGDAPSWTIPAHLAKDAYSHIHYDSEQARAISIREAARLQSFPDAFTFSGNMGDCFTQIGNAVPPVLAWAIASHVLLSLQFRAASPPLHDRSGEG
jgi:DNA (cytosine-5)-methyltransferase 1